MNEFKEVQLRATETQKACVQRARQNSMLRASNATPASSDTNLIDIRASPSDEDFDPLDGGAKLQQQQQAQQQKQAQIAAGNGNRFTLFYFEIGMNSLFSESKCVFVLGRHR